MKALKILKYIFTIFGAGMLIGAGYLCWNNIKFINNALTAQGSVVALLEVGPGNSESYEPLVSFKDNKDSNIEFIADSSSNPPSYDVGETVQVLYNPKNSKDAKIRDFTSFWLGTFVVGIFGILFFSFGAAFLFSDYKKKNLIAFLQQNGTKIETEFLNVDLNTSFEVNGRNPFQILSQWQNPATSKLHIFKSESIWFDPTSFIKTDKITVVIDRNNPKKYFMDLSFLPEMES